MDKIRTQLLQKTKIMFFIATLFVVGLSVAYGLMFSSIKSMNIENAELEQTVNTQLEQFYNLNDQRKLVNSTVEEREKLNQYFVDQSTVVRFFTQLETFAAETGVFFEIASARLPVREGESFTLQLVAEGSFQQVYHFFNLIENAPIGINITRADFRESADLEKVLWQGIFDVDVVAYQDNLSL